MKAESRALFGVKSAGIDTAAATAACVVASLSRAPIVERSRVTSAPRRNDADASQQRISISDLLTKPPVLLLLSRRPSRSGVHDLGLLYQLRNIQRTFENFSP